MKPFQALLAASILAAGTGVSAAADGHGPMHGDHGGMQHDRLMARDQSTLGPVEGGQSAFAAIQEIVAMLLADPTTDWTAVDIEVLRRHLIDMDNVTLRADVEAEEIEGGARFAVTSDDPAVRASIRAMTLAHAATMNDAQGWHLKAEASEGGAILTATGNARQIRALGFIGLMTAGMHHQSHHLALAKGEKPH